MIADVSDPLLQHLTAPEFEHHQQPGPHPIELTAGRSIRKTSANFRHFLHVQQSTPADALVAECFFKYFPQWAPEPGIKRHYKATLRRLVETFREQGASDIHQDPFRAGLQ